MSSNSNGSDGRVFDLYSVLIVTHRMPAELERYLEIIHFLAGGPVHTLAWPGVREVGARWLFHQHPQLLTVPPRPDFDENDEAGMDAWVDQYRSTVGTELTISPVPAEWWS